MFEEVISKKSGTLLCSGPMSKNCIDASLEIAREYQIPQMLIASRRQIDSDEFGGGYVAGFDTESFSQYVQSHNLNNVWLARDHGGPWQSEFEKNANMNISDALKSAKCSFESDINAGFNFIHIDPSVPIQGEELTLEKILERLFELYGHCFEYAQLQGKEIRFELGTEEQDGYAQDLDKFEFFLNETNQFCKKNKIIKPTFVVAQTGTRVMEMKNVGVFDKGNILEQNNCVEHITNTLKICRKYGLKLKEHNTDYLSNEALSLRPILGIDASNVAPEFGVVESRGLLYLMNRYGFEAEKEFFIKLAVKSGKWQKWMLPDSKCTDIDKALICGHYIFNHPDIVSLRLKLTHALKKHNIELDTFLRSLIKQQMMRYTQLFNFT